MEEIIPCSCFVVHMIVTACGYAADDCSMAMVGRRGNGQVSARDSDGRTYKTGSI